MVLNSKTRDIITIGTKLCSNGLKVVVTNIWPCGKGFQVTTKILEHSEKCWVGHATYGMPLSHYYGMTIEL